VQNSLTEAKHGLILPKALSLRFQALWFAVSFVSSIWFLYWICYDVIVWNKALTEAKLTNYVGLIFSIALAIVGTQLGRLRNFEKSILSPEQIVHNKAIENQQALEGEQIEPIEQVQQNSAEEEIKEIPLGSAVPPGCKFYLGYLRIHPVSLGIPEECLECERVVECLSPTASTKDART
jgi:hypothetical protein